MVEGRVVLEKIKVLEGRMKYQIEKLVRIADEAPSSSLNVIDGIHSLVCLIHVSRFNVYFRPSSLPTKSSKPDEQ